MTVTPFERGRFHVESHGKTYLVDLLCLKGNGSCECIHYLSRIKPRITEDKALSEFKPGRRYQCPHIEAARDYLLNQFITELRKQYPDDTDTEI